MSARTGALIPLDSSGPYRGEAGGGVAVPYGQLPSVTISFNLRRASRSARPSTRNPEGDAGARRSRLDLHQIPGHGAGVPGLARTGMPFLLFAAVLVVYILLGILYESFIHPLTILSGIPRRASARC